MGIIRGYGQELLLIAQFPTTSKRQNARDRHTENMDSRTYSSQVQLPEALRLVRAELGDDAAVLHNR